MSHETHQSTDKKQVTSVKSSFWFVLIIAGLFIAAVNFISAMSHTDEGHGDAAHTTEAPAHQDAAAPANQNHETGDAHGEGH